MKIKSNINGLHLWAVTGGGSQLWITTRRNSIGDALKKGASFGSRENPDFRITKIKYRGTIDA